MTSLLSVTQQPNSGLVVSLLKFVDRTQSDTNFG